MKRRTWIYVGAAGAVAVALLAWAMAPRPLAVDVARAERGLFESTIDEDGRTELHDRYVVSAPLTGRLARITLRPGDPVAAGDEVASLMPSLSPMLDARTQTELAARVEGARANEQRAQRQAEAARVSLAQARSEASRSEQLAGQGFVSPIKAESDRLAVQMALRTLQAAQAGQDVAQHELEVALAAAGVAKAGARQAGAAEPAHRFPLPSPVSGQVLRVLQPSEATVAAGTPLLEIGDLAQLEVVAELLTTDALQARPGSEVRIERWGGPGVLPGRVRLVEPAAFTKVSALGVEEQRVIVRIDLLPPPAERPTLGDGFRVGVRIVTHSEAAALLVPVSAVFPLPAGADGDPGGHAVFVIDGGRARQMPVELGGRNGRHAWIAGGLAEGATVIVYPPAEVADGVRVRAR